MRMSSRRLRGTNGPVGHAPLDSIRNGTYIRDITQGVRQLAASSRREIWRHQRGSGFDVVLECVRRVRQRVRQRDTCRLGVVASLLVGVAGHEAGARILPALRGPVS